MCDMFLPRQALLVTAIQSNQGLLLPHIVDALVVVGPFQGIGVSAKMYPDAPKCVISFSLSSC